MRTIQLGFSRIGYELKLYFRQGDSVFFTFLFPILMLSIFAVAGGVIFKVFGISLGAFKIAGGLMLLLMAVDMMRAQSTPSPPPQSLSCSYPRKSNLSIYANRWS